MRYLRMTVLAACLSAVLPAYAGAKNEPAVVTTTPALIASTTLPSTATASPAMADINGDGVPEIAMSVDDIGYGESTLIDPLEDPTNVNAVYVWGWQNGALQTLPGWPQKARDAVMGVSLFDILGAGQPDVLGMCSQDNYPPPGYSNFVSRLYTWDGSATPIAPWAPWSILPPNPETGNAVGVTVGHSYAPAVAFTVNGVSYLAQVSQGIWGNWDATSADPGPYYPKYGSLNVWGLDGSLFAQTGAGASAWGTIDNTFSHFSLDGPAVIAKQGTKTTVVAATNDGLIYNWQMPTGAPSPGWYPSAGAQTQTATMSTGSRAPVRCAMAAADLDRNGSDEILVAAGDTQSYNDGVLYNNGVLYCWNSNGSLRWKYPTQGTTVSFTSGVAVGRLAGGGSKDLYTVVGDAAGRVTAFKKDGTLLWQYATAPNTPTGMYPIEAQPIIGDVNNDGVQDVVVGGTNGYLYALNGKTGRLLWKMPTPTVDFPIGLPWGQPSGPQPEAIMGAPVLCDLQNDGHLDIVAATWQRYYDGTTWQCFGHLMAWDCGPNTYNTKLLDWPQYQRTPDRQGEAKRF